MSGSILILYDKPTGSTGNIILLLADRSTLSFCARLLGLFDRKLLGVRAKPALQPGLAASIPAVPLFFNPLTHKSDYFFIAEHLPQAICGQDEEITLLWINLRGGDDGFSCNIGRRLQELMGSSSEELVLDLFLCFLRPLVECISKGAGRFELTQDPSVTDYKGFVRVLFTQAFDL